MASSVKVTGVDRCRIRLENIVNGQIKKAQVAIEACTLVAAAHSKDYAPVDTSLLVNSQTTRVTKSGHQVIGSVLYRTEYADALENRKVEWEPKGSNPNARRGFLRLGFEDEGQKEKLDGIVARYLKL